MPIRKTKTKEMTYSSPWIIVGTAVILLVIVGILSVQNISREERYMSEILSEKGAALIRAIEAGARTGMMSMMWGGGQVQNLLEETARQPDILYLAVTDPQGRILAHSDRGRVGQVFSEGFSIEALKPGENEQWRLRETGDGKSSFEVYRYFRPLAGLHSMANEGMHRMMQGGMGGMMGRGMPSEQGGPRGLERKGGSPWRSWEGGEQVIFVGLDVGPFESARRQDIRHTMVMSAILLALGFGGFFSLFLTQRYRSTRRLLQDASAFADEVVSNLPVGLVATGRDGRIAFFNETAERITGLPFHEVRGKDPTQVFPSLWDGLQARLDNGETVVEEEMGCGFSRGEPVPLSVSASRILNEEGELVGNVLIFKDLGEVRRLQEEVRRKEKLAALGGLAAGVAHEIRNPLSSIKGLASFFRDKFPQGSQDKEIAEVMAREVDRLNRVISELLEFARPSDLHRRPTDVNQLLEHAVRLVQEDAKTKGIQILLSKGGDLPAASIDPDRFAQCFLNLFINAIQAMDKGGTLSVKSFKGANEEIGIEIGDTGKGIHQGDLKTIFDPYFTTKPSGTGLGLAIVHKIIEAHQGRIFVRSTPGKGTVFTILVPSKGRERS